MLVGHVELDPAERIGVAGLLHHAHEITAVTNQLVNSYKRLIAGYEAPVYVTWARNNQSALVRVPVTKRGKQSSTRIEYRAPDPACNPYLAFSVMLAAGLKGIEEGYDLPGESMANIFEMTPAERAAEGIRPLPQSLADALPALGIVAAVLGVVKTMGSIDQPPAILGGMIGSALVGTFMGVLLAYGIVGPLSSRLKQVIDQDEQIFHAVKQVIIASLNGYPQPLVIESARSGLGHAVRPGLSELLDSLRGR